MGNHLKGRAPRMAGKVVACVASTAMAVALIPAAAFADDEESYTSSNYVTAAASRAAEPVADILGMDSVEGVNPFQYFNTSANTTGSEYQNNQYYLYSTGITGADDVNKTNLLTWRSFHAAVNPSTSDAGTNSITYVPTGSNRHGSGAGPNQAFDASTDATFLNDVHPDVIVGDGGASQAATDPNTDGDNDPMTSTISTTGNYTGRVAAWNTSSMDDIIASTEAVAKQADAAAAASTKTLRYGSASDIATKLSDYVNGIRNYAASVSTTPNVAIVDSYDATNGFKLGTSTTGGTSINRYYETIDGLANIYSTSTGYATAADIYANNSFVLIGGNQSVAGGKLDVDLPVGTSTSLVQRFWDALVTAGTVTASDEGTFRGKVYWTSTTGAGAMYGTVMNSVENAQNYGRILPFIFEDEDAGFTQSAAMTYYVREFYHVTGNSNVTAAINRLYNDEDAQYVAGGISRAGNPALTAFSTNVLSLGQ